MSIAEKLVTVAKNVPKVFNSGQLSVISQSEALKGSASGTSVSINDISPVEHDVKCTISGEGTDLSQVKVQRFGKNLFNSDLTLKTQTVNGITVDNEGDGVFHFYGTATKTFTYSFLVTNFSLLVDPEKIYTIHAKLLEGKVDKMTSLHPYIGIWDTPDGSQNYSNITLNKNSIVGNTYSPLYPNTIKGAKADAKYITRFWFYANGIQEGGTMDFRIQVWINQSSKNMGFEPFTQETYTANADGTIQGNTYLYPSMTLIPDTEGVNISAEYIKDIDKTFNSLTTAVALTGGE